MMSIEMLMKMFVIFNQCTITTRVMQSPSVMQNAFSPRLHLMDCLSLLDMVNMVLLRLLAFFKMKKNKLGKLSENQQDVQNMILQCKLFIGGLVHARKFQELHYKLY